VPAKSASEKSMKGNIERMRSRGAQAYGPGLAWAHTLSAPLPAPPTASSGFPLWYMNQVASKIALFRRSGAWTISGFSRQCQIDGAPVVQQRQSPGPWSQGPRLRQKAVDAEGFRGPGSGEREEQAAGVPEGCLHEHPGCCVPVAKHVAAPR